MTIGKIILTSSCRKRKFLTLQILYITVILENLFLDLFLSFRKPHKSYAYKLIIQYMENKAESL